MLTRHRSISPQSVLASTLAFTIATLTLGCSPDSPTTLSSDAPTPADRRAETVSIDTASATLWVRGMSCPLCATNVERQLRSVPGVTAVSIDLGDGKVRVDMGPPELGRPSRRDLANAVQQSGFTLARMD